MSARYHARLWAEGKTPAEIQARIIQLESAPRWQGAEFDDARVNHMTRVEIETLRSLLETREWNAQPSYEARHNG